MKIKILKIFFFLSLFFGLFYGVAKADQPDVNFWTYNFGNGLLRLKSSISQLLIGGTATTTNAKLEVQGGLAFDNATGTSINLTNQIGIDGDFIESWEELKGNPFNQWLDTTSTVSFSNITASNSITLGGISRTTWPSSGSGGTDVNWVYDNANNTYYPATSTATVIIPNSRLSVVNSSSTNIDVLTVNSQTNLATTTWFGDFTLGKKSLFGNDVNFFDGVGTAFNNVLGVYSDTGASDPVVVFSSINSTTEKTLLISQPENSSFSLANIDNEAGILPLNFNVYANLLVNGNATTTGHLAVLGGNSDQWNTAYSSIWDNTDEENFWNTTSTWWAFDTNWVRNFNSTSTWSGFASQFAQYYNSTTTLNGFDPSLYLLISDYITYWNNAFNGTSTWHAFDSNWARNYNATTTLNGFTNNQNDWNTAYSWGNWSTGIWASSTLSVILSNAQTAFSWGNHALAGYLTQAIADLLYQPIGNYLNKDTDPYVETETDPIFMAASTSLPYIAVETDPIWTAASSSYLKVADWESTTTDSLAEGLTNLYYSDTRVGTYINSSTTIQDYFSKAYTAIQTESDPIWSLASTSVAYLANNQSFTGENTFTATTTFGLGTETLTVSKVNVGGVLDFMELDGDSSIISTFSIKDGFIIRGTDTEPGILFINEDGSSGSSITYYTDSDYFDFGDSDLYTSDGNSIQWNTAYSWGNHASAGYLTTESDPIWTAASTSYAKLTGATFTGTTTAPCFSNDGVNCFDSTNYWTDDTTNLSPNETRGVNIPTGTRYWYNNIPLAYASTSLANWFFASSGNLTATGTNNIGIGNGALQVVDGGGFNIGIGGSSLAVNTFGNQNIGIGFNTLASNIDGSANIGIGFGALQSNTYGSNNFAIGSSALLYNTTGVGNLSLGTLSLEQNTIGNFNIGIGQASLRQNISGGNNIGIGYNSLTNLLQSDGNIGIGIEALFSNTVAASNVGIGFQSLYNTNLASPGIPSQNNMGIGTRAGYNNRGFDNTFIGYEADLLVSASTSNNVIAIGSGIKVGASFAMAIGGINNVVSGYGSWSIGGWNNTNAGLYSGLSGGFGNVINGGSNFSHIIGGQDNLIELGTGSSITASQGGYVSGDYSAIFASSNSTSTGDYSTISGGSDNYSTGSYTSIFGSKGSFAYGTSSTVLGGRFATVDGELATIIGGEYNYASGWDATLIANTNCTSTGHGAFIMDSENSEANGYGSMIIQSSYTKTDGYGSSAYGTVGVNNLAQFSQAFGSIYSNITDTGVFSLMMNSSSSDIYAPRSVIIGGDDNTITNAYSNIYGGTNNAVSGMFSYAMGSYMTVAGDNSFGINLSPYYAPTPATLSQSNTMSIMGGSVGIGTTTPAYNMTIASTTNWLSLSQGTYGLNFSFDERGPLGIPLISGLASSTYVLGNNIPAVGVEDRLVIASDLSDEFSYLAFSSFDLSVTAQLVFDFTTEILATVNAKKYQWQNYAQDNMFVTFDAENEKVVIGTSTSNIFMQKDNDGWSMWLFGESTVWDDFNVGGLTLGKGVTSPDESDWATSTIRVLSYAGSGSAQSASGCVEVPHNYKEGSDIVPHVHLNSTSVNTGNIKMQLEYNVTDHTFIPATASTTNFILAAPGHNNYSMRGDFYPIPGSGKLIGSQICFRLFRNAGDTEDTYGDAVEVQTIGFHYQVDSFGSRQITTK